MKNITGERHNSIRVTVHGVGQTEMRVIDNGRPLSGDNLTACLYEACVNAFGACIALDHDKITRVTIEVFTPLDSADVRPKASVPLTRDENKISKIG